ncbi:epoxide hydrolase family protein [Beijerinckia sp. L45]|uniref:epoxide hydrolase family protein n=1 Tax=Beijerinckia sp. L45 TaxID=1641855 RepID=UPI00131C09D6|nr:epoxide hydrolase family protein [Beijerinckia sp. L45]
MPEIFPFPINVPERDLIDLRTRLEHTRLPEPQTVSDATQGIELDSLKALLEAWRHHDWRGLEARWNATPHYRTRLDGLDIAFWHLRSPEPTAIPLVLTHGWPGSVLEFEKILGPLTDPVAHGGSAEDAFHVVVPSLPGYGFSDRPRESGWNPGRTARAWAELMSLLGYERFGAHGGDWGASISIELARQVPDRVAGLHLTMPFASPLPEDSTSADDAEKRIVEKRGQFLTEGLGFVMIQATRPQTLGYALLDSPAGLAAWLGEKLVAFSDMRPEAGGGVSLAQQLDNIALYWFTGTGASTARWYWEAVRSRARNAAEENAQFVTVPTACTLFPGEPYPIARRWAERRFHNLISWNEMKIGGHYPGWEQPDLLIAELRNAFRHARRGTEDDGPARARG